MLIDDALELLSDSGIRVLAGGTDFYPALRDSPAPAHVLDISRIPELRTITDTDTGWTFGAATTWTDVINANLPPAFDGLKAAAREVGSIQIQNAATLAGNLCNASPAADGVPPLLALNASVVLATKDAKRTLPLSEFITGPRSTVLSDNELLVAIQVPTMPAGARSQFYKLGARRYLVISIAMVAITLAADEKGYLTDVRISVGACSAVAQRLHQLEKYLLGKSIHEDVLSLITPEVFSSLTPIDDVRASSEYRAVAAHLLVGRLLESTLRLLPHYQQADKPSSGTGVAS